MKNHIDNITTHSLSLIRQTPIVLLVRLLFLEFLISIFYVVLRIPKLLIGSGIDQSLLSDLNLVTLGAFIFLSVVQMILITMVSLGWANEYYVIKSDGVLHRRGVLTLKEETFSLTNIEALTVEQDIWGRLFNFGSIRFFSPVLKQEYSISNISNPINVKSVIENIVSDSKALRTGEKIIMKKS